MKNPIQKTLHSQMADGAFSVFPCDYFSERPEIWRGKSNKKHAPVLKIPLIATKGNNAAWGCINCVADLFDIPLQYEC
jgi:hypothetical protein